MSETTPRPYGTLLIFLFLCLLLAAVYYWMLPGKSVPDELQGVLRPGPTQLQAFELIDQNRQPFDLERLKGKWSLVFFGYTSCPDICPTTLSTLNGVVKKLRADPQGLAGMQVVFVTVDPRRDTADVIDGYLKYFNEAFQGVTGAQQDIDSLARQFGAGYVTSRKPSLVNTWSATPVRFSWSIRADACLPHFPRRMTPAPLPTSFGRFVRFSDAFIRRQVYPRCSRGSGSPGRLRPGGQVHTG